MGTPYIGEIRIFAGNFAPAGWAFCDGQLMAIAENDALFTLIGTTYGGDGQETFGLPDLQGRLPIHRSSNNIIGEKAGVETVTLTIQQIPNHTHPVVASTALASSPDPGGNVLAQSRTAAVDLYLEDNPSVNMAASSITSVGGNQPHDNTQPFLCVNFIISLFGVFPTQT